MITKGSDYDVVIVGASIAGATAATLLAREGARVALVEKRPDPDAFKRVCGHYIQPSALPVLERLGLVGELERAGAARGRPRIWTRYGWIDPTAAPGTGRERESLSLRRELLDPIVRGTAAGTPGVDLLLGHTLEEVAIERDGASVSLRRSGREPLKLRAALLVGADGRGSRTAERAGVPTRTTRNERFGYWTYFDGPSWEAGVGVRMWITEPDVALATPTDGGLTLCAVFPAKERLAEFKADTEVAIRSTFECLPDAPPLAEARHVGPIVGKVDLTNERRRAAGNRTALIGDAAMAADPVGAIGCGWALQSAEWLADAVGPALAGDEALARALRRYRHRHRQGLLGHFLVTSGSARAKPMAPPERLIFSAAVHDPELAGRIEAFAARMIGPTRFLTPGTLVRAARVKLTTRRGRAARREAAPETA